jgi:hypothetical protein
LYFSQANYNAGDLVTEAAFEDAEVMFLGCDNSSTDAYTFTLYYRWLSGTTKSSWTMISAESSETIIILESSMISLDASYSKI